MQGAGIELPGPSTVPLESVYVTALSDNRRHHLRPKAGSPTARLVRPLLAAENAGSGQPDWARTTVSRVASRSRSRS
jgi:hypothetical protein